MTARPRRRTRRPGPIFGAAVDAWAPMYAEYRVVLEAQYEAAVEATNANMVNARGRARGWDDWSVFVGPPNVVRAYASEELLEHLQAHPRTTLAAFEAGYAEQVPA